MHWSLSDMILDLACNSIEADSTRIEVSIADNAGLLRVIISDNGKGMDSRTRRAAFDPFYTEPGKHPGRKVGLGLPFLVQTAEQTGGRYGLTSEPGVGTNLWFEVDTNHIDCPPVGDLADTATLLMCFDGNYELQLRRRSTTTNGSDAGYTVSRTELQDALGDLSYVSNRTLVKRYFRECETEILPMEEQEYGENDA